VYVQDNSRVPDADIYVVSLATEGFPAFTEWAKHTPKGKIIVMGVLPTVNPGLLTPYAGKVVVGSFDSVEDVLSDPDQVVHRSTRYANITRYDACFLPQYNEDIPRGKFGITTSMGCYHTCDFCATRLLSKGIARKSVANLKTELAMLAAQYRTQEVILLTDNNFLALNDWEERMAAIAASGVARKVNAYGSADQVVRIGAAKLAGYPFFGVQIGLEDIDSAYAKNAQLDEATSTLFEQRIPVFFSTCIHPAKLTQEYAVRLGEALRKHRPAKFTLHCLVPDTDAAGYGCGVADYGYFNRLDPFLFTRSRELYLQAKQVMQQIATEYYTSDIYQRQVIPNFSPDFTRLVNLNME
jgi:hypothetical protein